MPNPLTETAFELPIGSKKVAVPRWLLLGAAGLLIIVLLLAKKGTAQATADDEGETEDEGGAIGEWLDQLEEELNQEQGPVEPPILSDEPISDRNRNDDKSDEPYTPSVGIWTPPTVTEFYSPSPQSLLVQTEFAPRADEQPAKSMPKTFTKSDGEAKTSSKTYSKSAVASTPSPQSSFVYPLAPRATTPNTDRSGA